MPVSPSFFAAKRLMLSAVLTLWPALLAAQAPARAVLTVTSKGAAVLTPASIEVDINGHAAPVQSVDKLAPEQTQVALLLDDGLRTSIGRQFSDIEQFINGLKPGVEVMVGYMQNGRVVTAQAFTADHAAAAKTLRLPFSTAGVSASPYLCLSDFVQHWSKAEAAYGTPAQTPTRKTRFVLMLTNGVDPYNGSTSPLNQDSPYVTSAANDAQRAGVAVYSIYFPESGIRGGQAAFSGQSYLAQVAETTGGEAFNQLRGNPPSLTPFFNDFLGALDQTYVATFNAPETKGLASLRVKTKVNGLKVRASKQIHVSDM